MLPIGSQQPGPTPHCLVSDIQLPHYISHTDPPRKKKPFSVILHHPPCHTLDLVLPAAAHLPPHVGGPGGITLRYVRVQLSLLHLVTGRFFAEHLHGGDGGGGGGGRDLVMISEGRVGIDNTGRVRAGKLTLEVDRATYESMGLEGEAVGRGRGGQSRRRQRYRVEVDLRAANMVSGKPGYERVKWAFERVWTDAMSWLVADLNAEGEVPGLEDHAPRRMQVDPHVEAVEGALVPAWPGQGLKGQQDYEDVADLLEWTGMVMIGSTRIQKGGGDGDGDGDHDVTPYLCRYQVPTAFGEVRQQDLVRLRWRGLIPPAFAQKVFLAALKASGSDWFAMSATAFDGEAYTILVHDDHSIAWEYRD